EVLGVDLPIRLESTRLQVAALPAHDALEETRPGRVLGQLGRPPVERPERLPDALLLRLGRLLRLELRLMALTLAIRPVDHPDLRAAAPLSCHAYVHRWLSSFRWRSPRRRMRIAAVEPTV